MMLLGIIKKYDEKQKSTLYYNWNEWHKDTFSPATEIITTILFEISGKTYQERKENLRQIAINFQTNDQGGLSYRELTDIQYFFEKNAKRYGLLKEFKNNCII